MNEVKCTFKSNGYNISAILNSGDSTDNMPIVIMCHGLSRNKAGSKYILLQKHLEKQNIASVRFDFQGHGESEGNQDDFSIFDGVENLNSSIRYLSKLGYDNFGLFGSSTGAEIACVYAAEHPKNIKALVLRAPTLGESYESAPDVIAPTLLIYGSEDYIPLQLQERLLNRFKICENELKIIEGTDHACDNVEHQNIMAAYATDWFSKNIRTKVNYERHII